jgi:hypothetical protein
MFNACSVRDFSYRKKSEALHRIRSLVLVYPFIEK